MKRYAGQLHDEEDGRVSRNFTLKSCRIRVGFGTKDSGAGRKGENGSF